MVNLVGNHISVLVLVQTLPDLLLLGLVRHIVLVACFFLQKLGFLSARSRPVHRFSFEQALLLLNQDLRAAFNFKEVTLVETGRCSSQGNYWSPWTIIIDGECGFGVGERRRHGRSRLGEEAVAGNQVTPSRSHQQRS